VEVQEAQLVHADAVGVALRVEEQASGGDEVPQEAEVRLVAVEAAIEVEDAVCRVVVMAVEDVEEASDSTLTSVRCRSAVVATSLSFTHFSCHAPRATRTPLHFTRCPYGAMAQPHYKLDPTNVSRCPLQGVPGRLNVRN